MTKLVKPTIDKFLQDRTERFAVEWTSYLLSCPSQPGLRSVRCKNFVRELGCGETARLTHHCCK